MTTTRFERSSPTDVALRPARFVTQTHALSAPIAQPRSILVAGLIAFALYLLGRRLSH